jgi:iron complex outermembrane recepter protein
MRTYIIFIFFLLYSSILVAQNGSVYLQVLDAEERPVSGATVKLIQLSKTKMTDTSGLVQFYNVSPGNYKIDISSAGLETKRINVKVIDEQAATLLPVVLKENINQLTEVTVIGGNTKKYVETAPSVGLRLNVPLIEVPQNIAVTTKQTMLNWGILSTSELARTVSGVVKNYGDFNDFSFMIRGTDAFNNIFRNGVGGYWWNQQEDAAMIERIEFVKGPAGFMIGNSEPGGLVNIITKQPTRQRVREVEFGFGSYNMFRGSIDLGGTFSEKSKFTYRLAAGGQTQNGLVGFSEAKRYFISPSLRYNFKEKTYLQLEVNRMGGFSRNGTSPTLPSINDKFHQLPNSFAVSDPNINGLVTWDNYSRLSFLHTFKNKWRINAQAAYVNGLYGGDGMYMSGYNATQDTIYRSYYKNDWKNNLSAAQAFVDGTVKQGKHFEHKILAGVDYGKSGVVTNYGNLIDSTGTRLPLSIATPAYGLPTDSLKEIEYFDPNRWGNEWLSLYVQDHFKIYKKVILTVAGRLNYARAWASYDENTVKDFVFTPRIGLTYLFTENISAFAVYDECYLPQTGRKEDNTSAKPLSGTNKEIGVKALLLKKKLSINVSTYHTEKNNILVANPATGLYVERGQITIQGLDVDMVGTLNQNISINLNYTYTDARITKDANVDIIGMRNYGTPENVGNVLLRYRFTKGKLKGLSAGAGTSYMGNKSGIWPEWNDMKDRDKLVPAYTIFDANVGYETRRFSITCNVFNLLNTNYVATGWYSSATEASPGFWGYSPGLPINFRANIRYRF